MQINGPGNVQGARPIQAPQIKPQDTAAKAPQPQQQINDVVDIHAQEITPPANQPAGDVRYELINRIRAEIAAGTYDTEEKWEIALERLYDDLNGRD